MKIDMTPINAKIYFSTLAEMVNDEKNIYCIVHDGCVIAICENKHNAETIVYALTQKFG